MKFVAEYVMRGRSQALWVAVLGASTLMFAWLSAAVLALVTLRKGATEGGYLLAWAVLPAGFLLGVFGDAGPLGIVVGTTALAVLLRLTVSWQLTLCASSLIGLLTGFSMLWLGESYLQQLETYFAELFGNLQAQFERVESAGGSEGAGGAEGVEGAQGQEIALVAPGATTIAGLLGLMNAISCIASLLLARWWQASLYNPGGFRTEFHGLRFDVATAAVLVLLMLGISSLGLAYRPWAALFGIPLSLAGLGLVHARAAQRGQGAMYLTVFYLLWILFDAVKVIVIGLAVADSWIDFRSRWNKPDDKTNSDNE